MNINMHGFYLGIILACVVCVGIMGFKVKALENALTAWQTVADTNASICKPSKIEKL